MNYIGILLSEDTFAECLHFFYHENIRFIFLPYGVFVIYRSCKHGLLPSLRCGFICLYAKYDKGVCTFCTGKKLAKLGRRPIVCNSCIPRIHLK